MRVFVTGATGYIGSAVIRELMDRGHHVVGLVRSDRSAAKLTEAGAELHRGDIDDLDSLRSGAAAADGVIHLAFNHDFSNFAAALAIDLHAVEAMGTALEGSGKPFVITHTRQWRGSGERGFIAGQARSADINCRAVSFSPR